MNTILSIFLLILISIGVNAQDLEVAGKVTIEKMELDNSAEKVVVRLEDGTLGIRDVSTVPNKILEITVYDTVYQVLSISGDTIYLENGGFVKLTETMIPNHYIGEFYGGGGVFWVDETGRHGLICDIDDIIGSWWYNGSENLTNATGNDVGSGEMNTMLIVARQTGGLSPVYFAALRCANLVRGSYGDWYLPSKQELNLMYLSSEIINATAIANGGESFVSDPFVLPYYWSSTEANWGDAWGQEFDTGAQFVNHKGFAHKVRAIRAF